MRSERSRLDVFSLLDFKVCLHSQLLNFLIIKKPVRLVLMLAVQDSWRVGPWRSLGHLPMANSIGVLTTQSYLCVSYGCCFTHQRSRRHLRQSGLVQIFGGSLHKRTEKLLEQPYTHLSSIWPRCVWSSWKSLHIVHSVECLHVMWMMESHVCTNRLWIHLEKCPSIHEVCTWLLMERYSIWIAVKCDVAPSETIR